MRGSDLWSHTLSLDHGGAPPAIYDRFIFTMTYGLIQSVLIFVYMISGKHLFCVRNNHQQLVCQSLEESYADLQQCHDNAGTGCHRRVNSMLETIQQNYYWLGVIKDVEESVYI